MRPSVLGEQNIHGDAAPSLELIKKRSPVTHYSGSCFSKTTKLKLSMCAHWKLSISSQYWIRDSCLPQKVNVPCTSSFHNNDKSQELQINKNDQ